MGAGGPEPQEPEEPCGRAQAEPRGRRCPRSVKFAGGEGQGQGVQEARSHLHRGPRSRTVDLHGPGPWRRRRRRRRRWRCTASRSASRNLRDIDACHVCLGGAGGEAEAEAEAEVEVHCVTLTRAMLQVEVEVEVEVEEEEEVEVAAWATHGCPCATGPVGILRPRAAAAALEDAAFRTCNAGCIAGGSARRKDAGESWKQEGGCTRLQEAEAWLRPARGGPTCARRFGGQPTRRRLRRSGCQGPTRAAGLRGAACAPWGSPSSSLAACQSHWQSGRARALVLGVCLGPRL